MMSRCERRFWRRANGGYVHDRCRRRATDGAYCRQHAEIAKGKPVVKKAMFVPTHRHRTGGLYVYRMTAEHTGTSEKLVIYTSFEGHSWARPEKEFAERFTALTMNESAELSRPYG